MKRVAVAYFWLCSVASVLAFLLWRVWLYFEPDAEFWLVWSVLLLMVHIRAVTVADEFFQKRLGVWKPGVSAVGGSREVPLGGVFEFVVPGFRRSKRQKTIDLADGPSSYVIGDVVLSADQVDLFVKKAWARQRSGKPGLSRSFWLRSHRPTWDRADYEAAIVLLLDQGFITSRRPGASGKLVLPSGPLLDQLRGRFS